VTHQANHEQPSEPEQPSQPEHPAQPEQPSDNGDTTGKNVEAEVISADKLTNVENVNNELTERLTNSSLSEVSIVSAKAAPTLSSNVFSKMKENQKDITVGVTDDITDSSISGSSTVIQLHSQIWILI